ncbi:N-acetylmuramoyl-L-alanine amidase [Nocardioides sp. HM23]|uniref:N-acetylmuramoyl-L-alanine amidase family protein n=1 Tax=Nocardioides bizhenqiangii TaxID=3095076 RepID=UPI002ACA61AC|nr:N-acetylmuramoyl-L-alanine amidase [Nocardioides sp. HM23]MDZ5621250.1 N-acetylmuramoyl-L-alanine amidase [Nocardioides sp. HM23]
MTVVAVAAVLLVGCDEATRDPASDPSPRVTSPPERSDGGLPPRATIAAPTLDPEPPLAGLVVVLDPGHQLGNAAFPAEVAAPVDAGGFTKPCNTTGTATNGGYPEASFTWAVAGATRRLLRRLGARVSLTRTSNSATAWGPCIDERGRAGNPGEPGPTADLKVSIHADGSLAPGAHGFHVIAPAEIAPWTTDIAVPSLELAEAMRDVLVEEGFAPSTYAGSDGIDVRGDLGTLNLADVPTVMVELGNMRDPGDAMLMTSAAGRRHYASALARSIARFLAR